jgi:uncharacterized protein DUF4054
MSQSVPPPLVTFDYATWAALFPELSATIGEPTATLYFGMASSFVDNTPCSLLACNIPLLTNVLNLLTAHWAKLFGALNGEESPQTVGRISQASQGSVSLALDMGPPNKDAAFFNQTKYGAAAWQMLLPYRTARYLVAPRPYLGVGGFGYPGGYWNRPY